MDMQSFILPANGAATPDSISRRRKMAEAMMQSGMDTSPIASPWQGAARMAQALVGGLSQRKADKQEAEGKKSAKDALAKALMGGDKATMLDAMSNPWMDNASLSLVGDAYNKQFGPRSPKLMEVDGRLYNPSTQEWITPPPKPQSPDARAKIGLNPQYGIDEQGNPVLLQLGENGEAVQTKMPDGVTLSKEPIKLDAGTHFVLLDPITRQPVGQIPKNVAGEAAQQALGKEQGSAQAAVPAAKITAEQTISKIDELLSDPNIGGISGIESWLPDSAVATVSGSGALGLRRRVEQLKGTAFLEAYNGLRGGGQITEVEGKKAEDAMARLETAQNDADYVQALMDFREAVQQGYEKLAARSGGAAPALNVPSPASTGPQPGSIEDGYRFKGGDPANPNNWEPIQ